MKIVILSISTKKCIGSRIIKWFIIGFFTLCYSIYVWPFFTGDMALSLTRGEKIFIPEYYIKASKWIRFHSNLGDRVLWLPSSYEGSEIKNWHLFPSQFHIPLGFCGFFNSSSARYVHLVLEEIVKGTNLDTVCSLLKLAKVKFIIVNLASSQRDLTLSTTGGYLRGSPTIIQCVLAHQRYFQKRFSANRFCIYEIK